ncbi:MAG: TetR/AcrR family transcriptional regulator [Acidimicrobiia bacterium]
MARLSRNNWVDAAYDLVSIDAQVHLTIDDLSERLGATKGSFYHHFTDRSDLLIALDSRRVVLLDRFVEVANTESDPEARFRAYCVASFSSREYLNLEGFLERERVEFRDVDKAMADADTAAETWQLEAVKALGYHFEDAPRYLRVLKAAAMGMVFFMMHEGRTFTLEERVEFANTLVDLAMAGARSADELA